MARRATHSDTGPRRVLGYARVSTGEQLASGLGLEAQREAIRSEVARRGWELVGVSEDTGSGRSLHGRPAMLAALEQLDRGEADALIVAKLDRATRSVADAAALLTRAQRHGWKLVALDLGFDMTTPARELVASVMSAVARWERRAIGARTREALAAKRAQGVRLGRPRLLSDAVRARVVAERRAGRSLPAIAGALNADGVPTAQGSRWYPASVARALRSAALDGLAA
ncbi:MAG TPA: recombinase family protein [Thermomicrobiaceae bacterium]|nr:recombinase family protein [Thermomicrobiaceae bacterium]